MGLNAYARGANPRAGLSRFSHREFRLPVTPAKAGVHVLDVTPAKAGVHVLNVTPAKAGVHFTARHVPGNGPPPARGRHLLTVIAHIPIRLIRFRPARNR